MAEITVIVTRACIRFSKVKFFEINPDVRCRVAIICRTVCFCIPLHFVITLEAPLDVEEEVACGSQGEEDGPPRNGNSIDSLGRLMLWGISHSIKILGRGKRRVDVVAMTT